MNQDPHKASPEKKAPPGRPSGWVEKFAVAGRGVHNAFTKEASFVAHFVVTAIVLVVGFALGISRIEWCLVVLCVMAGLGTELLNTAIERLAKAITQKEDPHIRDALDIASGAVLVISIGATVLAVLVLGRAAWNQFF